MLMSLLSFVRVLSVRSFVCKCHAFMWVKGFRTQVLDLKDFEVKKSVGVDLFCSFGDMLLKSGQSFLILFTLCDPYVVRLFMF
jgi:hypothetical protein